MKLHFESRSWWMFALMPPGLPPSDLLLGLEPKANRFGMSRDKSRAMMIVAYGSLLENTHVVLGNSNILFVHVFQVLPLSCDAFCMADSNCFSFFLSFLQQIMDVQCFPG